MPFRQAGKGYTGKAMQKTIIKLLILLTATFSIQPVSLNQATAERILKENRYFLQFIDVSVTNFGTEKNIDDLKKANKLNFQANLEYLQGEYVRTYKKIVLSQKVLRDLYQDVLDKYLIDTRKLLDISAPIIVQARDKKAQLFLRLGYRDLEVSRQFKMVGFNYNRFLFSNKIRFFIDGIKRSRQSKRFAFLAIIESKTPIEEKSEYKTQTIDEALRKFERDDISDYERIRIRLTNMMNRKLVTNTHNFFLHHDDNYGHIEKTRSSILQSTLADLQVESSSDDKEVAKDKVKTTENRNTAKDANKKSENVNKNQPKDQNRF